MYRIRTADDLVGIQSRVQELEIRLKLLSSPDSVYVLGIWGMGGIGKTTLATVLYDKLSYQFDACCFVENISNIYGGGGDIIDVHKQILCQTMDEKNLETKSPSTVAGIVKERLSRIKVLIVLDNVDKSEQLEELAIRPKWLGAGSRIIITTRDQHIIEEYGVDAVYEVPLLSKNDSHQLFYMKAFKRDYPSATFEALIPEVLSYAKSLPLAIKVLGSFLYNRDAIQWRGALKRLLRNPDNKIMDVLQISLEGLEETEREIFLHIACFFKGQSEDYVKRILDCCDLYPDIGIPVLVEKSLVTIRDKKIQMHELLQELGKKVVRGKFPNKPELWSRLWLYDDFIHVMETGMGASNVEAIVLDPTEVVPEMKSSELASVKRKSIMGPLHLPAKESSKMEDLKLLILHNYNFSGYPSFLSNNLHFLSWHDYPFICLPSSFQPRRLVELNLPNSKLWKFYEGYEGYGCQPFALPNLRRMNLSYSDFAITPNFRSIPLLERLDLTGCRYLRSIDPSIGCLKNLAFLSLRNCTNLLSLYFDSDSDLSSLKVLDLSGCSLLEIIPGFTALSNLEYLDLQQCTSLLKIDKSIGVLTKLKFLSLRDCTTLDGIPHSINALTSLQTLELYGCSCIEKLPLVDQIASSSCLESLIVLDAGFCKLRQVPDAIGDLRCLERLNLEGNNFVEPPSTLWMLSSLAYLNLAHCYFLQSLPDLPSISASSVGMYFKMVSQSRNQRSGLYIFDCPKLVDNCDMGMGNRNSLSSGERSVTLALSWLKRLLQEPGHFRCGFDIVIPGNRIPEWFGRKYMGGSISIQQCSNLEDKNNWIGFAFSVAFSVKYPSATALHSSSSIFKLPLPFYLAFESEVAEECFETPLPLHKVMLTTISSKHVWVIYISRPHCHFVKSGARIAFKAGGSFEIREWGLRCVFKQETGQDHLPFDYVYDRNDCSNNSYGPNITEPKILLPYNWLITEEDEVEEMEAVTKENYVSNMGLE